ncbi:hypothetical protein GPA27_25810 [Aromatoleum toluolicum]|uniref:Uncharacterized protein n=1 Tax=Aromatoleum toluolicum TaxID=90060 RepID=A0ABX1NN57_9RHOO|nr:hypothetical protein [Aromatoleum toluolicum]NMG00803.1 hypothetical protein [Aromatoleum toluolicum]
MLTYINKAVGLLGFRITPIDARALRYQRASKSLVVSAIFFYAFLGWFGISFFDISENLGNRGAGCALQFVFSGKTVLLFFVAVILMAIYLLRPHLKPVENTIGKRYARAVWRTLMFFAFLWVGFYQALGGTMLGIAIYIAMHEFKTSTFVFVFGAMCLFVGVILKIQGPELLWKIRRRAKPYTLRGAIVSMASVVLIAVLPGGLAYGGLVESMKPPASVQCPQPRIIWG